MASSPNYPPRQVRRTKAVERTIRAGVRERDSRDAARHGCPVMVARKLLWESARRARALPRVEMHDPQWMMLLELFVAGEESRTVNVKTLCMVSHVPSTTAARHLTHLERLGMVRRTANPADGRSFHFSLAAATRDRMRAYLDELDRSWLMPAPALISN